MKIIIHREEKAGAFTNEFFFQEHSIKMQIHRKSTKMQIHREEYLMHVGRVRFVEQVHRGMSSRLHYLPSTHIHEYQKDNGHE